MALLTAGTLLVTAATIVTPPLPAAVGSQSASTLQTSTSPPLVARVAVDWPHARSGSVLGTQLDSGPVACHCPRPTTEPDRTLAHPIVQAASPTVPIGDGDRRRDLIIMSAMIGRRHVATALTLQPYQLSVSPKVSPAGVAMPAYRQ